MSPKNRRLFTAEQKAEAVRIAEQSDKSISQVAKELGISGSALRKWVNQSRIDERGTFQGALTTSERQELVQLRRQVKRLEQERAFLKKAAAFFAKDSSTLMN
jgi:transposase